MSDASQKKTARPRRFQFSIRFLLMITAVVAVLTSLGVKIYRDRVVNRRPMQFIRAVKAGDLAETDRLLTIDPQLAHGRQHGTTFFSHTPLQSALVFGRNPKVVDRILAEKPNLEETSEKGQTALHLAIWHNSPSEVARLLRLGANPNVVDEEGLTPLHMAASIGDGQMVPLLLEAGSDPNGVPSGNRRNDGKSPLHVAAENRNTAAVAHLLNGGADVNGRDRGGQTPLHVAMSRERESGEVSELLLEHGADLTAKDNAGQIPGQGSDGSNSELAVSIWWERISQLLEEKKIAQLDEMLDAVPQVLSFRSGGSPATLLHRAVAKRRLDVLDYLLGRHMDPNVRAQDGRTPLHSTCSFPLPVEFARHLLDAGADVNAKDGSGRTPLHWAAEQDNRDLLQVLLAKGADIGALDSDSTTVLDAAFERAFHAPEAQERLELLRQAGHPATVLYAAATGDISLLESLTGGDSKSLDRAYTANGIRPLHAAVLGEQPRVIEWLLERGVECDPRPPVVPGAVPIDTPLIVALGYSKTDIALLLIDHGADVNVRSFHGHYPVHAVIEWDRDPRLLEALLNHGADPTLKHEGKSAMDWAVNSPSQHRARYLELLNARGKGQ